MTSPTPHRCLVLLLPALVAGCGGAPTHGQALSYGQTAHKAYLAAMDDFHADNCIEAEPEFRKVSRRYPYSRYAALADLRAADCMMKEGKYAEAIQAYRQFVRYRPSHRQVPYARFKIAEGYFKQIPSDWLLSPAAYERDQGPTRQALEQLRRFLLDYSDSAYGPKARTMQQAALAMLAHHELYVARFYLERNHPRAAVSRLQTLLDAYQGSGVEPEALLLLGRTYLHMAKDDKARDAFQRLLHQYPHSGFADQARGYLHDMAGG